MDGVSQSANTVAGLNGGGAQDRGVAALKMAAEADKAILQVVEQAAQSAKATNQEGQGRFVDRLV
jgi:hypothetical protein